MLVNKHIRNMHRQKGWEACLEINLQVVAALHRFERMNPLQQFGVQFWATCPWMTFLSFSSKNTSCRRLSLLLVTIYSAWAFSALFYSSTALAPGQDIDCDLKSELLTLIVSSTVVAIGATLLARGPAQLLGVIQGWENEYFWSFAIGYLLLSALVICIFLASVSAADGTKWLTTVGADLAIRIFLGPASKVSFRSMAMRFRPQKKATAASLWPEFEEEGFELCLAEIAVIDDAGHVFSPSSESPLRLSVEVLGHPQTSVSCMLLSSWAQADLSDMCFQVWPQQTLIFSIFGSPSTSTLLASGSMQAKNAEQGFQGILALHQNTQELKAKLDVNINISLSI